MSFEADDYSYYPPAGRYHFAGFDYDRENVYAVIAYTPKTDRPGAVSTVQSYDQLVLRCETQTLTALHDMLPDGKERDYIAAIHDAVEALDSMNVCFGEAIRLSQRPSSLAKFNETARSDEAHYTGKLEEAMKRLQAFDDRPATKQERRYSFD